MEKQGQNNQVEKYVGYIRRNAKNGISRPCGSAGLKPGKFKKQSKLVFSILAKTLLLPLGLCFRTYYVWSSIVQLSSCMLPLHVPSFSFKPVHTADEWDQAETSCA